MPRKGRNTIQRHIDHCSNDIDRIMYNLKCIDDIYSGAKNADYDDTENLPEFVDISETDPYAKYRLYVANMVAIGEQYREALEVIKSF